MIRIGLVRFDILASVSDLRDGRDQFILKLQPQAKRYKILFQEWQNNEEVFVDKDILAEPFEVSFAEPRTDLRAIASSSAKVADELASQAVRGCFKTGLVDGLEANSLAACYIVKMAVLNAVKRNEFDVPAAPIELIDLARDMREMAEERKRRREEEKRLARERWEAHQAEAKARWEAGAADRALALENLNKATKTSFDLLYSILSDEEATEARSKGQITLKLTEGTFVVPVLGHGLVKRFDDKGNYTDSYCIVFRDYTIPVGDEVLMKVALLKADPKHFFETAYRHKERRVGRLN